MNEVIIKYKTSKALQALKDFAKYVDFTISSPNDKHASETINGVTIIRANTSVDTSGIKKIFTGKNIGAKELRNKAWQRK